MGPDNDGKNAQILELRKDGASIREIAAMLHVGKDRVRAVLRGRGKTVNRRAGPENAYHGWLHSECKRCPGCGLVKMTCLLCYVRNRGRNY